MATVWQPSLIEKAMRRDSRRPDMFVLGKDRRPDGGRPHRHRPSRRRVIQPGGQPELGAAPAGATTRTGADRMSVERPASLAAWIADAEYA